MNGARHGKNAPGVFAMLFLVISRQRAGRRGHDHGGDRRAHVAVKARRTKSVPTDAMVMFTILFPIRMVEISRSYSRQTQGQRRPFWFPLSARTFSLVLFKERMPFRCAEDRQTWLKDRLCHCEICFQCDSYKTPFFCSYIVGQRSHAYTLYRRSGRRCAIGTRNAGVIVSTVAAVGFHGLFPPSNLS